MHYCQLTGQVEQRPMCEHCRQYYAVKTGMLHLRIAAAAEKHGNKKLATEALHVAEKCATTLVTQC